MTNLKDIVFETDRYWVKRVPKGFEVYKTGLTHSTRVAVIGYTGDKGLQRAKDEIARREATGDRHHATKQVAPCTVAKYLDVLSHELVRYDVATSASEAKRGRVNIYRMGLLMEALGKVRDAVGSRTSDSEADKAGFRMAMYQHFERDFWKSVV